jgi:hypothetical protein
MIDVMLDHLTHETRHKRPRFVAEVWLLMIVSNLAALFEVPARTSYAAEAV